MTERQATRAATAANPSTLRPDQQSQHHWHPRSATPSSSSAQASDQLTPDTDSDGYGAVSDGAGRRFRDGGDDAYDHYDAAAEERSKQASGSEPGLDADATAGFKSDDEGDDDERARRSGRRGSSSSVGSFHLYTPDEERAVVRKLDRRLVLFMALLYMLSFLDRSNIGNARIAGMDDDLQSIPRRDDWNEWALTAFYITYIAFERMALLYMLSFLDRSNIGNARIAGMDDDLQSIPRRDDWYEWALTAFYITYIAFEWMAVLWRLIPAHIYVSVVVFSWGLIASLQAVAVNYPMLILLRALLGIGEAAFTGVPVYLSFFFKRDELAFRTAIFISAAPLATTFASSLAWVIIKIGESSPIAPWRLLFLIEGFPSVIVAAVAWNIVPDSPQTAYYLTSREKKIARLRLRHEVFEARRGSKSAAAAAAAEEAGGPGGLDAHDVLSAVRDPVAWMTAAIFFLTNMAYSSLPAFLPTILTAMGHSPLSAQALAAPPYLAAFFLVLAVAHASDRSRSRGVLVALHALASAAGYGVLALSSAWGLPAGSPLRYAAVFPAAAGFFGVVVLTVAWAVNNQASASRRAGGFALLQAVGQCGPLLGTRLYPDAHAPFYTPGMATCAVAMVGVAVLAVGLRFYLARLNRRMDETEQREGEGPVVEDEEEEGLVGHPREGGTRNRFRYML